ncbi:MAG: ATP synthase F1 subunit delta [Candidatus Nealsonbacteria bacterium]|nr:ATP synthase F1 subunit delta [Candidatus Nealsonbacteria bacterium]
MKKITPLQYAILLYEITLKRSEIKKQINGFLGILAKNNDLGKIDGIIKEFEKYEKKQKGVKDVEIISAKPIAKDIKAKVLEEIEGEADLKETVNPDLLGGIIVTVDDMMTDGSLKRKLKELSEVLT